MKINRHISILLTFLILASNMGMALNVHYCEGEVSSVSLAYKQEESCGSQHKETADSCCAAIAENHKSCCENDLVKLHDDHSTDNIIVKSLQLDLVAFYIANEWKPSRFSAEAPLLTLQNPSFYCESHAPPLFKLYCQYIFYA